MDLKLLTNRPSYNIHPESKSIIRFHDCDPYRHLNQSEYLNYFVDAREDHLREHYGLDVYQFGLENGHGWMVVKNQIAYLRQVMAHEVVTIQTHLIGLDSSNIQVEMLMWDELKTKPKALLWGSFTYVNLKEGKRALHPDELIAFLSKLKWDGPAGLSFDERISDLYTIGKTK